MTGKRNSLPGVVKLCNRRIAELEAQLAEAQAREAKLIAAIRNVPLLMSGVEIRDWQSVVLKETGND